MRGCCGGSLANIDLNIEGFSGGFFELWLPLDALAEGPVGDITALALARKSWAGVIPCRFGTGDLADGFLFDFATLTFLDFLLGSEGIQVLGDHKSAELGAAMATSNNSDNRLRERMTSPFLKLAKSGGAPRARSCQRKCGESSRKIGRRCKDGFGGEGLRDEA